MSQDPEFSRNSDYYSARAVEERRLAMAATDSNARAIHLELADKYERLAEGSPANPSEIIGDQQRA